MEHLQPVIIIQDLCKAFGSNVVLNGFSLTLYRGENVVVLGKSGSGKSVLIKCIIGLLPFDSGRIEVLGQDIGNLSHPEMDQLRTRVGFLFQSNALYDSMTVRENLEFPMRRHRQSLSAGQQDELVMEVLESVRLPHTVDMMPSELSGGMRKRIALARTLILEPEIILYDEPTTGLDPITSMEIIELIQEIQHKRKASSIMISHDLKMARIAADRVVMLIDGQCRLSGTYDETASSTDPQIQAFFA
jgi:phospholipid/cholesterol/gamma-HCH transport system ATP-binding protein